MSGGDLNVQQLFRTLTKYQTQHVYKLALARVRWEDQDFRFILGCMVSLRLAWVIQETVSESCTHTHTLTLIVNLASLEGFQNTMAADAWVHLSVL